MGSKHVWESDESLTSFDVFLRTLGSSGDEVKVGEDINVVGEQLRVDFFELSCNQLEKASFFTGLAQLGSVNPNWRLGSAPKKPGPAEVAWLPAQPSYMSRCNTTSNTAIIPTLSYPGTEFEHYNNPDFPNSPPTSSPKPLPVPPPHFHDSVSISPPVTSATNSTYASPVKEGFIKDLPSRSPSPALSIAMVLYYHAERRTLNIEAMNVAAEEQTLSPTGPQPGVFPGPGWKDNFTATGTRHFFVIPDGKEDVIAPFISYDLDATFPELLATNGHGCTVHSRPLHAHAVGHHHSPISPKDELLLQKGTQYADLIDWALVVEDDITLIGEVKYFQAHYTKSVQIAQRIGMLKEALQTERATMYCSSDRLAAANAINHLRRRIDRNDKSAPYFTR